MIQRFTLLLALLSILVSACAPAAAPPAAAPAAEPVRAAAAAPSPLPSGVVPSGEDPRIHEIVGAVSAARLDRDVRRLVGFGTRHTLSDTVSRTRGIGAARRWIFDEFQRISAECGGCLEVMYVSDIVPGDTATRIPRDTKVVNVVAVQRGRTDPTRHVVIS